MRKCLNILSLDLDWFNKPSEKYKTFVGKFFQTLPQICTLPEEVTYLQDHHYLFPWAINLLKDKCASKLNIYNVDQHHDFYYLTYIGDYNYYDIDCGNFFAFMAYRDLINEYHWITDDVTDSDVARSRREIRREFNDAYSKNVQNMRYKHTVSRRSSVWRVLSGKTFDGFVIVKSPEYTIEGAKIFEAAEDFLIGYQNIVKRNLCSSSYVLQDSLNLAAQMAG